MTARPFITTDNQLDALALIEAVANGDEEGERAILRTFIGGDVGGLVTGLTTIAIILANVGVQQRAWSTATDALALARLGILDTPDDAQEGL